MKDNDLIIGSRVVSGGGAPPPYHVDTDGVVEYIELPNDTGKTLGVVLHKLVSY